MLHAQLFNVNTTCHNIPLGGNGSAVTPPVPRPPGSTFSQSDSGVIPIPTPFRCFNGSYKIVLVFLTVSSAVSLEVLFISPPFSSTVLLEVLFISPPFSSTVLLEVLFISPPFSRSLRFVVVVAYRGLLLFGIGLVAVAYRSLLFGIGLVVVGYRAFFFRDWPCRALGLTLFSSCFWRYSARCLDLITRQHLHF